MKALALTILLLITAALPVRAAAPTAAVVAAPFKPAGDQLTIIGNIAMVKGIQLMMEASDLLSDPDTAIDGATQMSEAASLFSSGKRLSEKSTRDNSFTGKGLNVYPSVFTSAFMSDVTKDFEISTSLKITDVVRALNDGQSVGAITKNTSVGISAGMVEDAAANAKPLTIDQVMNELSLDAKDMAALSKAFKSKEDEIASATPSAAPQFGQSMSFQLSGPARTAKIESTDDGRAPSSFTGGPYVPPTYIPFPQVEQPRPKIKFEVSQDIKRALEIRGEMDRPLFEIVHKRYQFIAPRMDADAKPEVIYEAPKLKQSADPIDTHGVEL